MLAIIQRTESNDKGSITNNNLPANAKGMSTVEVNTHCVLKGKPTNHMLLATTTDDVQNKSVQTPAVTTHVTHNTHFCDEKTVV